ANRLCEENPKKGALLRKIAEDPPRFVTSTALIMLVARVAATVLITSLFVRHAVPFAEAFAILVMSFVLFQMAEIAPRTWVLERLDRVLLISARPVYLLGTALRPLSVLLLNISRVFLLILPGRGLKRGPLTSEEEIKSILDVAESEEVIEPSERDMIHSIFEFGDTVVREVMVPRPDMICVEEKASLNEVLDLTIRNGLSRMPVISENIDNVTGIIYAKDVVKRLQAKSKVRRTSEVAREPSFVPETKKVSALLSEMQKTKNHMVIVVDEYGGTAGLVTMEDLLEEIVGEISDEYDRDEPSVVKLDDQTFRMNARVAVSEVNELLSSELPHEEWDSVGGLVAGQLGRVPFEGELVALQGIEFEVEKMKGRRIERLLVRRV
ncbi:MAG: hemolysin family protein, partial [Actinomycetota bacterium]